MGHITNPAGFVEVIVDVDDYESKCPCKEGDETGIVCSHVRAVLLRLGDMGTSIQWTDSRFHTDTYKLSYDAEVPAMSTVGRLLADRTFIPPDYKRAAGRPSKKRKERSQLRSTAVRRECKACGALGHFAMNCPTPSTQFR